MQNILSFFSSPGWMTVVNTGAAFWGALEATGVTNVLNNSKAAVVAAASVAAVNAFAHAISAPVAGPAASSVGTGK